MGLNYFTNTKIAHQLIEPIYAKQIEVQFSDNEKSYPILTESFIKMSNNWMSFNSSFLDEDFSPLKEIMEILKSEKPLEVVIKSYDKQGTVLLKTILSGFKFTKFEKDLGLYENGERDLKVEFSYEMKHVNDY